MSRFGNAVVLAVSFLLLNGCTQTAPPANTAADEAAIRAINPIWFKAYTAGDVEGVVALYADDAVFSGPGAPAARGPAAIREYFKKDIAESAVAGITFKAGPKTDVGVSGDLGWEWGTFTVLDKSGATVDVGKYVSIFRRKDGKWQIIRDIYNSDTPPPAPAPAEAAPPK